MKSSLIQVLGRLAPGAAQARITPSKSRSMLNCQAARRIVLRRLRAVRNASSSKIARGSGHHQVISGSEDQGKTPAR